MRYPNVLLLSDDEVETGVLREIFSEHTALTAVSNLPELVALLESDSYDALFSASSFQTGRWNDVLEAVRKFQPELPVIILSSAAEERTWIGTLEAGAFDLLAPPYQERSLLALLEQASASREARVSRHVSPVPTASALPVANPLGSSVGEERAC